MTVGINASAMEFTTAAVGFNNCVAGLIGLAIVISPLKLGLRLSKGWNKPVPEPEGQ